MKTIIRFPPLSFPVIGMIDTSELNELEIWIVSHLAVQQLKIGEGYAETVSAEKLIYIIPDFLLHSLTNTADLNKTLRGLWTKEIVRPYSRNDYYAENSRFYISPDGLLLFRKFISPLAKAANQPDYQKRIDATSGNDMVKKELKNLQGKLKDKTEDEAIDAFIDIAKQYGHLAIIYLVKLLLPTN